MDGGFRVEKHTLKHGHTLEIDGGLGVEEHTTNGDTL